MSVMSIYALYGLKGLSLMDARSKVESALGCFFEERESSYQAGIYYRFQAGEEESFVLKNNLDPFDGEAVEAQFAEYDVLLYVDATQRSAPIRSLLGPEFCLLREEAYD